MWAILFPLLYSSYYALWWVKLEKCILSKGENHLRFFRLFEPITRVCIWPALIYLWHDNLRKTATSTPNITSVCGLTLPFLLRADACCNGIIHLNTNHFKLSIVFRRINRHAVVYILLKLVSSISFPHEY